MRLGLDNDDSKSVADADQTEEQLNSQTVEQIQPSQSDKRADDTGPTTTKTSHPFLIIQPEEILRNQTTDGAGLVMLGDERYVKTTDGNVDLMLMKIRDAYKLRKRHLKEARKFQVLLSKLCNEMQDYVCGYEVISESDQTE